MAQDYKEERIRTYPVKGLVIFLSIAFVVSLGMIILMAFLKDEMWVIRILVWILCSIFTLASGTMLIQQLFFYIEVRGDYFIKHFMLSSHKIPLKNIDKIVNKDGWYDIYVEGKKIVSFATNTKESQEMIIYLEKHGVKIDW